MGFRQAFGNSSEPKMVLDAYHHEVLDVKLHRTAVLGYLLALFLGTCLQTPHFS
jgi:hypothetical protein